MVLQAADAIDKKGPKGAQREIGMVKVFVPRVVQQIIDEGGFASSSLSQDET